MKFVMSYSCGKDSALALHRMIQAGHQPVALLTTVNIDQGRSWFHGVPDDLLAAIADSIGVPVITARCKPDDYTAALETALTQAKELGAEAAVFGDIDIEDHKSWNTERCAAVGLDCLLPLWQEPREALTREVLDAGFVALIKIVQVAALDETFLGQTLSPALCARIAAAGADICGENGEYHTIVVDGPIFRWPVAVNIGALLDFGSHKAVDITLA